MEWNPGYLLKSSLLQHDFALQEMKIKYQIDSSNSAHQVHFSVLWNFCYINSACSLMMNFILLCILERRNDKRMNCKKKYFYQNRINYWKQICITYFFQPFWNAIHQNYLFALINKNVLCKKGTVSLSDVRKESSNSDSPVSYIY